MKRLSLLLVAIAAAAFADAPPPNAAWSADPKQSRLEFVATQAGAPLRAGFHAFSAAIDFSPQALASAKIEVEIHLGSVDSQDQDRDETMKGKEGFDVAEWPDAHYRTRSVEKTADGFHAAGALTLHGVTREVPIDFRFTPNSSGAMLEGTASLKRLEFGVGQGEWKSTEWIGDQVRIHFSLQLVPRSG